MKKEKTMQPTDGYVKTTIAGVPYLLPYGQQIADHAPSIRLNASGSLLWDALTAGATQDELLALLAKEYDADPSDLPALKKDLDCWLNALSRTGMLASSRECVPPENQQLFYWKIGPLVFSFDGPSEVFFEFFSDFSCAPDNSSEQRTDQHITVYTGSPAARKNGRILIRTDELIICDAGDEYHFLYSKPCGVREMHVTKDGSAAVLFVKPEYSPSDFSDIFHALRFAFLILAQNRELYVLHSASILYAGRAWLFSGASGTGKSTHAALWHDCYHTQHLNGDLNLLGIGTDSAPLVYGLPWCGTSGIHTAETYPLGGIVFLKQAPENRAAIPAADEKALLLMQRLISPSWNEELLAKNIRFSERLTDLVPIFRLYCTAQPEAAETIRRAIDRL